MQFTYQLIQNHTKTLTPQPFATTSAAKDTKAMQLDDTSNEDTSDQTSDDEDIGCDKQNNTRNELNAKQTRHSANASVYQLKNGIKETDGSDKSGANRLKFMCSWIGCDLRFRDNYALKAHIRLRHTNERPFACTDCHKSFADKKHLKEHQKIHSTGGQMFRCEFTDCHYETRREANLKEHVLRHKNIRNYKCDESGCDKSFVTNYELKVHKSHVHSEDRPFTCDWPGCEATYKSKQRLDDHKLSHLGVRQFACDFHGCAKNFITKKKLTQHRNEHIKPYACSWPECGEAFGNNRALKAHMNAHEGVRPYKCQFPACVKAFYSKPQLNSHLKSAHKNVEALDPLLDAIAAKSHALSNADPMSANPTNLWTNTAMIANQTTHSNKDQTSLLTTQHMPDSYQQKLLSEKFNILCYADSFII
ncbi:unnamed protein product [Oppiella nova]|uniref:C2H2-type domain-containing protein n=1 Tax=Oppiella nova TaxID=334625 RepID=A0A7R9QWA0_9ACAR|nr:unnamed protein product [Oppiella nova]CAG2177962.1 unnamed protein product [Oppiella nova]